MSDRAIARAAQRLGLQFVPQQLLEQALAVPRASAQERDALVEGKERLEYLGDAVIELIVSAGLFDSLPDAAEGTLSALRAAVVSAPALARLAHTLGVPALLGIHEGGDRGSVRLLAATLEALAGAVYIAGGLDAVQIWLGECLGREAERLLQEGYLSPKTMLQEQTQRAGRGTPVYRVTQLEGPPHERRFTVVVAIEGHDLGKGIGPSRRAAEQLAAQQALQRLSERG
ncbi:MAG: ribonuclease III [Chloroflexi bacterium]|nr:ribonuclease III [Chloroflexota bacterium]